MPSWWLQDLWYISVDKPLAQVPIKACTTSRWGRLLPKYLIHSADRFVSFTKNSRANSLLSNIPSKVITLLWKDSDDAQRQIGDLWNTKALGITPQKARFMGPTWGPSGADRIQVGPTLAPWILLFWTSCVTSFLLYIYIRIHIPRLFWSSI